MAKKTKNSKAMKRRNFLKGAGAAALGAAAVSSFPAPAISGGHMEWIACSAFGKASGLGKAIDRFASYINNASDKLKITVMYRGREFFSRKEDGIDTLNKVVEVLKDISFIDKPVDLQGRRVSIVLSPK